jgi:hypothetical protein
MFVEFRAKYVTLFRTLIVQRWSMSGRRDSLPNLPPIGLTFALAFELSAVSAHSSAAPRADPIENAGYHICTPPNYAPSHHLHTHLPHEK